MTVHTLSLSPPHLNLKYAQKVPNTAITSLLSPWGMSTCSYYCRSNRGWKLSECLCFGSVQHINQKLLCTASMLFTFQHHSNCIFRGLSSKQTICGILDTSEPIIVTNRNWMSLWTCELITVLGLIYTNDVEITRLSSSPTTNTAAAIVVQLGMNSFQTAGVSELRWNCLKEGNAEQWFLPEESGTFPIYTSAEYRSG